MKESINFGFWKKVKEAADASKRPIFTLAPMADVTDAAFRRIIAKYSRMSQKGGGPDALWTEFVSADGLCSAGRKVLLRDLAFSKKEKPIVAQLFTSHPDKMKEAAALIAELGFDGLDINMGCPDRSIEKQKAGAAMMKDVENAVAVIKAAREGTSEIYDNKPSDTIFLGVREFSAENSLSPRAKLCGAPSKDVSEGLSSIPISVKTRIGYNKVEIDTWIRALLEQKLPVLTVHLRTRKEMSDVPAHWELMPEIIRLCNEISPETLIIGNGDVESLDDAKEKAEKSGCDGIMFGRAIFGNPWLFDRELTTGKISIKEKLRIMVEHTELFMKLLGDIKSFATMKKHYKAYVNGWDGAKELRMKLMEAKDAAEVKKITDVYLKRS
jgi:tRNA-dihydrouridine synthase